MIEDHQHGGPPAGAPGAGRDDGPPHGAPGEAVPATRFTDNSGLAKVLLILSGTWSGLMVLAALLAKSEQARFVEDSDLAFTTYQSAIWLGITVRIAAWVVVSLWLTAAYDNARAIDPNRIRRARGWVWFGWGVPVVQWWFPKTIVDDVWSVTAGREPQTRRLDTRLWWGLWVLLIPIPAIAARTAWWGESWLLLHWWLAVGAVAAFMAWIPIVRGLTAAQTELARGSTSPDHHDGPEESRREPRTRA